MVAGVAVIAVHGMLVQRTGLAWPVDGVIGYDGIRLNVLAALADASAADRVTVPRTGGVGGIGVIAVHAEMSRAIARAGMTVTLVTHGEQKADLAPTAPLSQGARTRLQTDVDAVAGLLNRTVAANRGRRAGWAGLRRDGAGRGVPGAASVAGIA